MNPFAWGAGCTSPLISRQNIDTPLLCQGLSMNPPRGCDAKMRRQEAVILDSVGTTPRATGPRMTQSALGKTQEPSPIPVASSKSWPSCWLLPHHAPLRAFRRWTPRRPSCPWTDGASPWSAAPEKRPFWDRAATRGAKKGMRSTGNGAEGSRRKQHIQSLRCSSGGNNASLLPL